jgi:D-alanyl-D-alanine carboxypeptidase (penicillin-binding protein 5/6)
VTAEVVYSGPLMAPLAAGQQVAELVVHVPDLPDARIPLVTEAAVEKAGFARRLGTAATVLYGRLTAPEAAPAPGS